MDPWKLVFLGEELTAREPESTAPSLPFPHSQTWPDLPVSNTPTYILDPGITAAID